MPPSARRLSPRFFRPRRDSFGMRLKLRAPARARRQHFARRRERFCLDRSNPGDFSIFADPRDARPRDLPHLPSRMSRARQVDCGGRGSMRGSKRRAMVSQSCPMGMVLRPPRAPAPRARVPSLEPPSLLLPPTPPEFGSSKASSSRGSEGVLGRSLSSYAAFSAPGGQYLGPPAASSFMPKFGYLSEDSGEIKALSSSPTIFSMLRTRSNSFESSVKSAGTGVSASLSVDSAIQRLPAPGLTPMISDGPDDLIESLQFQLTLDGGAQPTTTDRKASSMFSNLV